MPHSSKLDRSIKSRAIRPSKRDLVRLFALGCVALGHIVVGGFFLWSHLRAVPGGAIPFRAPSGLVLIGLGVWHVWRTVRSNRCGQGKQPWRGFWRCSGQMLLGAIAGYLACLLIGDRPGTPYVFLTIVAAWFSLVDARFTTRAVAIVANRSAAIAPVRTVGWLLAFVLFALFACEMGLRVYALWARDPVAARFVARRLRFPAGATLQGQRVNSDGYWDDPFVRKPPAGTFRVAVLGDEIALCGTATTNCLAMVEATRPGIEIYNFGLRSAGPREYAAQLASDVASYRPDLVVVFFAVGTDITETPDLPGLFDWRSLHLVQRQLIPLRDMGHFLGHSARIREESVCRERNDFHAPGGAAIRVCHSTPNQETQAKWAATFANLDEWLRRCRAADLHPAMVVVPSVVQADAGMFRAMCRRAGSSPESVDVDLPQRRLAAFARDRDLPMLDLLPHFRASRNPPFARHSAVFSDHGNALTAQIVGHWLEGRFGPMIVAAAGR